MILEHERLPDTTEPSPVRDSALGASHHRFLVVLSVGRNADSFSGVVVVVFMHFGTKQYLQIDFFSAILNFKAHPNES